MKRICIFIGVFQMLGGMYMLISVFTQPLTVLYAILPGWQGEIFLLLSIFMVLGTAGTLLPGNDFSHLQPSRWQTRTFPAVQLMVSFLSTVATICWIYVCASNDLFEKIELGWLFGVMAIVSILFLGYFALYWALLLERNLSCHREKAKNQSRQ